MQNMHAECGGTNAGVACTHKHADVAVSWCCLLFLPRRPVAHAPVQQLALAYWSFHYTKRIVETFTIHK